MVARMAIGDAILVGWSQYIFFLVRALTEV